MPLIDYALIIISPDKKKHRIAKAHSLPRIGEKIVISKEHTEAYTVISIIHDYGFDRVIIETA